MLTCRRRSKNSGGGIAPAAIGALIEGRFCTVNGFRTCPESGCPAVKRDKVLMRLNFLGCPANA